MDGKISEFLTYCKVQKNLSEKTLKAYRADLKQYRMFQAKQGLAYTDKALLKLYLQEMSDRYKVATIKRKIAVLKTFFGYLEFEDAIPLNPCRKIRINLKEPVALPRTLTLDEIRSMFAWLYSQKEDADRNRDRYRRLLRDIAVIELLFFTGMRVAELCGIRSGDIDLKEQIVRVRGKGSRERLLFIGDERVTAVLAEYRDSYAAEIGETGFFLPICGERGSGSRRSGYF